VVDTWQATGIRVAVLIQSLSSIGAGIIIAFIYSWEFALFILGLAPFFIIAATNVLNFVIRYQHFSKTFTGPVPIFRTFQGLIFHSS